MNEKNTHISKLCNIFCRNFLRIFENLRTKLSSFDSGQNFPCVNNNSKYLTFIMRWIIKTIDTKVNLDTLNGVNFNSSLFDSHLFSHLLTITSEHFSQKLNAPIIFLVIVDSWIIFNWKKTNWISPSESITFQSISTRLVLLSLGTSQSDDFKWRVRLSFFLIGPDGYFARNTFYFAQNISPLWCYANRRSIDWYEFMTFVI